MSRKILLLLIPLLVLISAVAAMADDIKWISQDDLKALLDDPDTTVIDVRQGWDWKSSDYKVEGAVREDPSYIDGWAEKYDKDAMLVFY